MTITALSRSLITASVRRRYLTGAGHASPKASVSAAFGQQYLQHRLPDHQPIAPSAAKTSAPLLTRPSFCPEPTNQINQRR